MTNDEIAELFSYTANEQETFPYLRAYMKLISARLPRILENDRRRERFMLAGLFLTYKAINFAGESMTTEVEVGNGTSPHTERLLAYKQITRKSIRNTLDYVKRIWFIPRIFLMYIFGPGRALYWFVMYG